MAKFGFLSVLEEELDKHLDYDFAMDWDKKNHAVEVTFILEAQNSSNVETIDDKGEVSDEDVIFKAVYDKYQDEYDPYLEDRERIKWKLVERPNSYYYFVKDQFHMNLRKVYLVSFCPILRRP